MSLTAAQLLSRFGIAPTDPFRQGAIEDNVTIDAGAIAAAIAATPQAGSVFIKQDTYIGTARVSNPDGVRFDGRGLVRYQPDATRGRRVQNCAGRDLYSWGSEYLFAWLNLLTVSGAATVRMTGDSTTVAGYSVQLQALLARIPNVTTTLAGISGKSTADWISTYLANDIAAAPTVLIWHWGMNDAALAVGSPTTMAQFESNLRTGLTSYRAAVPIGTGGIILMTPNACSDGTNQRDEWRNEKMRQIIRNAAEEFQCAFYDTYGSYQDGYVGIGSWLDNTYADGIRGVHPQQAFSQTIAGDVYALMIPQGIQQIVIGYGFVQGTGSALLSTDAMSTYPLGISIRRSQSVNGFPLDGWVFTWRESQVGNSCYQMNYKFSTDIGQYCRTWNSSPNTWGVWRNMQAPNIPSANRLIDAVSTVAATIPTAQYWTTFDVNTAAAAFAVTLPAPVDGEVYAFNWRNATGAISWVATAPATNVTRLPVAAVVANQGYKVIYNAANTAWYPY